MAAIRDAAESTTKVILLDARSKRSTIGATERRLDHLKKGSHQQKWKCKGQHYNQPTPAKEGTSRIISKGVGYISKGKPTPKPSDGRGESSQGGLNGLRCIRHATASRVQRFIISKGYSRSLIIISCTRWLGGGEQSFDVIWWIAIMGPLVQCVKLVIVEFHSICSLKQNFSSIGGSAFCGGNR